MDVLRGPCGPFLLFVQVPMVWVGRFLPFICFSFLPPLFFFFHAVRHVISRSGKRADVSVEQKSGFVFVGITSCVCHSLGGVRYLVKRVRSPTFEVAEAYVQAY